ncbi:uncharacterized protein EKO05_0005673 [Ascochyta rabiei]|uniref:Uncharacterized protein n=1 Tax=Didymella rabiei TaxID=5454 RepID=A0A163EKM7_DIDRA|nr:uncharacterized protein EKO05_0005673 [Ascochyta rabiei]KZM23743.1 hypothetical protein ST47_g5110 [Ascochyta rabiei]UPX15216.1 hypothetical protein EKO05_0005673 [Ascochyta rabiei]
MTRITGTLANSEPQFRLSVRNSSILTLSLSFPPFDLNSVATPTHALVESFSKLSMLSPSIPNLSTESSPGSPPADMHSKVQAETPRHSRTNTMNNVVRAFSSSKTLHHVLGMRESKPFVTPPEVPRHLREQFEAGLQRYEQLFAAGVFAEIKTEGVQAIRSLQKSKAGLADILEEKESPARETTERSVSSDIDLGLKINIPKWTSDKQAVAVAQWYTFFDSDSDAAQDTASEPIEYEFDVDDQNFWRYGSSATLAASDDSRPGSSASRSELSSAPAPSFPPRTSSLFPQKTVHSNQRASNTLLCHASNNNLPPVLLTQQANNCYSKERSDSLGCIDLSRSGRTESLPLLFSSEGVEQRSGSLEQTWSSSVPSEDGSNFEPSHHSHRASVLTLDSKPASLSVPQITVQLTSPKKAQMSGKRAPPSDQNGFGPRGSQRARRDDTVGLPTLPSYARVLWKSRFPGNTHALLTILLTWSQTMWLLHHRLPDPKLFAIHPAFPYSVSPPLARQLLSVSFYDTSIEPHKEVRFLGPGDVAEMSYHEVDVFNDPESQQDNQEEAQPSFPINAIKQTLGRAGPEGTRHMRFTTPLQRAKTGSGRWCYILLKGHETHSSETPPHIVLAWHNSAITATSNCLHTIHPANAPPATPSPPPSKLKRFSSLQNLGPALRKPARFNFHQTLRSASSSSELPPVDAVAEVQPQGSVTLQRTVLKLERAGGVPLIEGYRVDVAAFSGWLDACGRGKGKVIMWRERDGG